MIAHIKHYHPWKIRFNKQLFQKLIWVPPEAIARMCFTKTFTKFSQNSQENTFAGVSFWIELQASSMQLYYKIDSGTGIFLQKL